MECLEGALKSSCFRPETVVKSTQHEVLDDFWAVNAQNGGVIGDDFSVDDLLDFSNGGIEDGFVENKEEEDGQQKRVSSVSLFSPKLERENEFGSVPGTELTVPADDLANLEWLSHFVEDSFSGHSLTFPAGKSPEKTKMNRSEPELPVSKKPCFATPLQTKARSKRAGTGGRVWSLGSPLAETSSSSSTSSSSTSSSSPLNRLICSGPSQTAESLMGIPPTFKRQKKLPPTEFAGDGAVGRPVQPPRRCTHCLVQKTPQWRNGPLGPKTLCNACGVRYKSGRLLPEYRPACSPTFSGDIHSNNHRKVLEMRRKKECFSGGNRPRVHESSLV